MICATCPLSLVCLGGFVRVTHCNTCHRTIVAMPPRWVPRLESPLVRLAVREPMVVIDYLVAQCDTPEMLPPSTQRNSGCPQCEPDNVHHLQFRLIDRG